MFRTPALLIAALVALFSLSPVYAADAATDPAAEQVDTFYTSLLETMKHGPQLGMQGRFRALLPAIDKAYDLTTMMQFIVGPSWGTMSDADKSMLVSAFRRLTAADYASNFDKFAGERFEVDPNVLQRGSDRIVQTNLIPKGDKPVALIYRMRQNGGTWKIIDVYLAGFVDQAALKRSDFASTLSGGGPKALADKINTLTDSSLAGAKGAP
ncbi:MAG: ABC transporter substrate-binding protein [Rhizomicrobium sp.]|jgi:phospholipid transport system substrate-binding protein